MFSGWTARGLAPSVLVDPQPAAGLARAQDQVVADLSAVPADFSPAAVILAVKPQMADPVLAALSAVLRPATVVVSIMAGRRAAGLRAAIGGAVTWWRREDGTPKDRRQTMDRAGAASTFSTDWEGVPPGRGQSDCGAGAGRKKSWPLSVSETASCSLD